LGFPWDWASIEVMPGGFRKHCDANYKEYSA